MKEESMKKVSDVLDSYAYKNGKDHIGNFNDWLAWMCKWFDIHTILECESMSQVFQRAQQENPMYFEAMSHWIDVFNEGVTTHGAWDSFGTIYEACYQSKSKAGALGQFFTPANVSDLMAQIVGGNESKDENGVTTYYDCACGSGRTLVSAWKKCDQYAKNFFMGGDLDGSSVNGSNFSVGCGIDCSTATTGSDVCSVSTTAASAGRNEPTFQCFIMCFSLRTA